jgi:hypothetical protein
MAMHLPYRRLAQAAEWSLLATVVLLHAAGWLWFDRLANAGPLGALLADSLPLASLILLTLWLVLGPGYAWVRGGWAASLAACALWSATTREAYSWEHIDVLLAGVCGATFVGTAAGRLGGLRVCDGSHVAGQSRGATFSIRSLLAITTAIAILMGGMQAARPWLRQQSGASDDAIEFIVQQDSAIRSIRTTITLEHTIFRFPASAAWNVVEARLLAAQREGNLRLGFACLFSTAASLLAAAAVLRPGAPWLRIAGLAILIPAAGWYIGNLTETGAESTLTLTLWAATTVALVAGSLVPLRLMGYRLVRPNSAASLTSPSPFAQLPRFSSNRDHLVTNQSVRPSAEVPT